MLISAIQTRWKNWRKIGNKSVCILVLTRTLVRMCCSWPRPLNIFSTSKKVIFCPSVKITRSIFFCLAGNQDTSLKRTANPPKTASEFDVAFTQLCDPFLPVRGHAIMKLGSLLRQRDPKALESTDALLKIFLEQLSHDDSYIYLAAIQGLVSLADTRADIVIPRLAREFAICRMEASSVNANKNGDKEKGCYVPSDKG